MTTLVDTPFGLDCDFALGFFCFLQDGFLGAWVKLDLHENVISYS